jgi:hypothetical protein
LDTLATFVYHLNVIAEAFTGLLRVIDGPDGQHHTCTVSLTFHERGLVGHPTGEVRNIESDQ